MHTLTRRSALTAGAAALATGTAAKTAEPDPAAMLARAEQMVDLLRTRYIREGWKVDEEGAERTLRYFRRIAAGGPDDDWEWETVVNFISNHGQSLDWIIRGDHGGMICMLAARSAVRS